jgi:hypothetical protein
MTETMTERKKRIGSIVRSPESFDLLLTLANLLPKVFSKSGLSDASLTKEERGRIGFLFERVRDWTDRGTEAAPNSAFYLMRLLDAFPLELQAFVLTDSEGEYIELLDGSVAPCFDPSHFQPEINMDLLKKSNRHIQALLREARQRFEYETKRTIQLIEQSKSGLAEVWDLRDYQLGEKKFREIGLERLVERARERLMFVFAADELLAALTSNDVQENLNAAFYAKRTGSLSGKLFVKDDAVRLYPPFLFRLVLEIEVSRIRRCRACDKFFWAGRKNQQVCSVGCGATYRKRNQRIRDRKRKLGILKRKVHVKDGSKKS